MRRTLLSFCVFWSLVAAAQDITLRVGQPLTFVVYGDTRFTDPADHARSNPDVRQALVRQIAADDPAFVVISGDIVLHGVPADWQVYEAETAAWRAAKIPVLPALGNHELAGAGALSHYFAEFPQLGQKRWYSARAGNVLLLVLDSNLDDSPASEQGRWLDAQFAHVPGDVDFVLVLMHHPVYTQSFFNPFSGGHAARDSEQHLGALLQERQRSLRARLLVFSGHVHNYERYEHGGVTYVVSGGGGAPIYPIRRAPGDAYTLSDPTYHYCRVRVNGGTLSVDMVRMEANGNGYAAQVRDHFQLTAGAAASAAGSAH